MSKHRRLGWPNRITITRMLLIGPFVVCLLNQDVPGYGWLRWAAIGVFGLMAISDLLDGYLARRLRDQTDLGRFLDPLADKLLITSAVLILCAVGIHDHGGPGSPRSLYLPNWVAVAAIGKDLLVSIGFVVIYLITGRPYIRARPLGKWCTTVQLGLVLAMLVWPEWGGWFSGLPRVLWTAATILAVGAALDYLRIGTRHLARAGQSEAADRRPPGGA